MSLFDTTGELTVATVSDIAARTSTVTSSAYDTQDFKGTLTILQQVGTVSGTSPTLDGKIQDCDTSGGTYADVSGLTFTQVTASNNAQSLRCPTRGLRRYIKYVGTIAGTTPSFAMGVVAIGQKNVT